MQFVGMDVHKRTFNAAVLDEKGNKILESKFGTDIEGFESLICQISPDAKLVMEACSVWQYPYDYFAEHKFDIKLAHPLKTKAIGSAKIKTDKIDAKTLALLLRADLIPESYVPPQYIRQERQITRHRASLVAIRTEIKNKIHAILARHGINFELSDIFGKSGIAYLKNVDVPEESRFEIDQYLDIIDVLDKNIQGTSENIEKQAMEEPGARLLMSVPGISYYSALLIIAEIGDIRRFKSSRELCSYAGLVPSTYQSGNHVSHGSITKQGSRWLRWILIQAVHSAIKRRNAVQQFYKNVEKRKGTKVAAVASARKLLGYIYVMLTLGLEFDNLQVNRALRAA
jgi:transposase